MGWSAVTLPILCSAFTSCANNTATATQATDPLTNDEQNRLALEQVSLSALKGLIMHQLM